MNIRKSTLVAAVGALMSIGMVGQAAAYTSAGSKIEYENLSIVIRDSDGDQIFGNETNFNFVTTNLANLNGDSDSDTDNCAGVIGTSTCNPAPPRLDSDLITKGTTGHTANNFSLDGPNAGTEYSYADSVIQTAQLVGDPLTNAGLIGETELLDTGSGNSTATIQSTTGFLFTFTVGEPGLYSLQLSFDADPDAYAASDNPDSILAIAESSVAMVANLTEDNGLGEGTWSPDGNDVNDCNSTGGLVTCDDEFDPESLNEKAGITSDQSSDFHSYIVGDLGFSTFGITFENIDAGNWTFTLTTTVANSVNKVIQTPEPGTLLMLGGGLAGLAVAKRRRRKQA